MKTLDNVLECILEKEVPLFLADANGRSFISSNERNSFADILFFPRKKLKMQKIKSGYWNPLAWFIEERLNHRVTSLDFPTDLSKEGITSGFRSAVIRNSDGRYFRIKGVSQKAKLIPDISKVGDCNCRGMCLLSEAMYEQMGTMALQYANYPHLPMHPGFVESHLHLFPQLSYSQTFKLFNESKFLFQMNSLGDLTGWEILKLAEQKVSDFSRQVNNFPDGFYRVVSGFEIKGDTRLDEAIYHLTKSPLSGEKKEIRDNLLYHLCFWAGVAKSELTLRGFSWSDQLDNTNNHIGNFVLYPVRGFLQVGICDLGRLKNISQFPSKFDFFKFVNEELDSFRDDFMDKTFSFPSDLNYRHFTPELREDCFLAFKTSYLAMIHHQRKIARVIPGLDVSPRYVVPREIHLTCEQFRTLSNYVMN